MRRPFSQPARYLVDEADSPSARASGHLDAHLSDAPAGDHQIKESWSRSVFHSPPPFWVWEAFDADDSDEESPDASALEDDVGVIHLASRRLGASHRYGSVRPFPLSLRRLTIEVFCLGFGRTTQADLIAGLAGVSLGN